MFRQFFSAPLPCPARRRRSAGCLSQIDGLESRLMPAADLKLISVIANLKDSINGNYVVNMQTEFKNQGNTAVNLTGMANNPADDVTIRVFGSKDAVLDANDPVVFANLTIFNDNGNAGNQIGANSSFFFSTSAPTTGSADYKYLIFKIDPKNVVAETNETNNTFAVDMRKPEIASMKTTLTVQPGQQIQAAPEISVCDLNSTKFLTATVSLGGAQLKDRLKVLKSGSGDGALKIVGTKVKLGGEVIGTVAEAHVTKETNACYLKFKFSEGGVAREVLNRLLRNVVADVGNNSTGQRKAYFTVTDEAGQSSAQVFNTINILS